MTHPLVKCSLCCCFVVPLRQRFFFCPQSRQLFRGNMAENKTLALPSAVPTPSQFVVSSNSACQSANSTWSSFRTAIASPPPLVSPISILLVQVLKKELRCHRLELQVNDLKQHIKQMVQLTALHDQENSRMQK